MHTPAHSLRHWPPVGSMPRIRPIVDLRRRQQGVAEEGSLDLRLQSTTAGGRRVGPALQIRMIYFMSASALVAAVLPAIAIPAAAQCVPDPVFAAIANHRLAAAAELRARHDRDAMDATRGTTAPAGS